MAVLKKKIKFDVNIRLHSGLHIGDSKENVQIGAVDSVVVRRRDNDQPYIPGSSVKGKMRCLLEQSRGASDIGGDSTINLLFGTIREPQIASRVIFRDAYLTEESVELLEKSTTLDAPFTEIKYETAIDRIKGNAKKGSLRKFERIPAGVDFASEIILNVWDGDQDLTEKELLELLTEGITLLNNDYLGGCGSRGYGQVVISLSEGVTVYAAPQAKGSAL
ncbi:MAG TPA: type III-A CRISPR-associated RAMP protein Csm3 [Flavilitoribacter sp.]|nr:type III-A CRISPR-associated RAMP protein Csm3 [Flavilitoribacter sp.]HMQ89042.1 type III-A CRISPR-associated RAMP protein Csm3 [Flavilitoribacter sp.]